MSTTTNSAERGRPVMKDVARHAGVSLGTVSNVLNNPDLVSAPTRERVLQAIEDLGFVRNSAARSLVRGSVETVGFVIVDLANSFFLDIARGVQSVLDERGIKLLLANSDVDLQKQDEYLTLFEETQLSGILLAPLDAPLDAAVAVRERGTPVVQVNWPGDAESCGVVSDDAHGGYLAARHLIEQGCRRLAFAGGPLTLSAVASRHRGALRAVAEADGVSLELIETQRLTVRGGHRLGEELARRRPEDRPDGLVAAADALASGAIHSMMVAGLRVPEDMAVVGYDNNHFADDSAVPLTTVGQPGHEMGRAAARLLLEEFEQRTEHLHRTLVLKPRLFERTSSAR
jgi:LacI family transcriptional regulator